MRTATTTPFHGDESPFSHERRAYMGRAARQTASSHLQPPRQASRNGAGPFGRPSGEPRMGFRGARPSAGCGAEPRALTAPALRLPLPAGGSAGRGDLPRDLPVLPPRVGAGRGEETLHIVLTQGYAPRQACNTRRGRRSRSGLRLKGLCAQAGLQQRDSQTLGAQGLAEASALTKHLCEKSPLSQAPNRAQSGYS